MNTDTGVKPRSIAAVYTIGLKAQANLRRGCGARLELVRAEPETPNHPPDLTRAVVDREQRPLDVRLLLERHFGRLRAVHLGDLHVDQVADLEQVGRRRAPLSVRSASLPEVQIDGPPADDPPWYFE